MHTFKIYFLDIFINFFACFFNIFSLSSYPDNSTTISNYFSIY